MILYCGKKRITASINADRTWLRETFSPAQVERLKANKLIKSRRTGIRYGTHKAWRTQ